MKYNHIKYKVLSFFLLSFLIGFGQKNDDENYIRLIDSADYHLTDNPKLAATFLDSIPKPFNTTIVGHISCYYQTKGLIHNKLNENAKAIQNYLLALNNAEKEENFDVAGRVCLELYIEISAQKKNSTALNYLEKSKKYYKLAKNEAGLIEVLQMQEFIKFQNNEYKACNTLILENINTYKNYTKDAYYYMYANFMLATNYIYLGNLETATKYLQIFYSLKENPTINLRNFLYCEASLNTSLAEFYISKKQLDSTFIYLSKASKARTIMNSVLIKNYYSLYTDAYKLAGDIASSEAYIDSLQIFQEKELQKTIDASLQMNNILVQTENDLKIENKNKNFNKILAITLLSLVFILSIIYFVTYKKLKNQINDFIHKIKKSTYLESSHDKLKIKVQGLETYISELKVEIKNISALNEGSEQRKQIKELYKNIHIKSSTILNKEKGHLELINKLNVDFFTKIQATYPELNPSEVIICYYLFTGFKNKEIAQFLNISTRAVESKRYRIDKKINSNNSGLTLIELLNKVFKDSKKSTINSI